MHLFCFTHAGGTASFYNILMPYLEPFIELESMEYAGHGARWKEAFYQNFKELADDLYPYIRGKVCAGHVADALREEQLAAKSYAILGYSMGSIAAVEILNKILIEKEFPPPVRVFLAAHEPYTKSELKEFCAEELDEMVKERTIRFGGIPESLISNRSFWRLYLPIYRADYSMIGRYDFEKLALKTSVPVTVFYSEEDTPLADMEQWKEHFTGVCEFIRFHGGHFFIQQHSQEIAAIISERLLQI